MIRRIVVLAAVLAIAMAVVVAALTGAPGHASIEWLGWRVSMTAAAAVFAVLFGAFLSITLWRVILWVIDTPARATRVQAEVRRRQGAEALTRGFLAAAAGDGSEARRQAMQAADWVQDMPALVRVLTAQAAEAAGDLPAAHAAYSAMLGFPEMRLAGQRGLMQTALAQGKRDEALRHAQEAYGLARTARWAWRALLEDRLEAGDWSAALELTAGALERKIVSPIRAERARAALLAASAASLEASADPRQRAHAVDFAQQSAKLNPGFAPGAAIAARLLVADAKTARAGGLIEQAWKLAPHPALALVWRDLKTAETPKERARRFAALAALNPDHRESRILDVEQALLLREPAGARAAATLLADEPAPSARICGLMARVAFADGKADEARAWMARGTAAALEPDWSDLDPEGRAFAYTPVDWARLVSAYSETGELIHPRLERRERGLSELPALPPSYEDAAPYLGAGQDLAPDDPGPYGDGMAGLEGDLEGAEEGDYGSATVSILPTPRRGLATRPRPAK